MNALITFQNEKMHENLGFNRFADFLDKSDYSPMSKTDFYRRKELFESEGAEIYDAFNAIKIPMSTRKLIAQSNGADIVIEGDEILIGDERADLSDLPVIKTLIKSLASANEKFTENRDSQDKKIEKLESQVKTGLSEFEELRRSFDAAKTGTPYEQALVKTIGAMINLSAEARNLTLVEKEKRGRSDIKALWTQMLIVRNSLLQDDFVFTDVMNTDAPEISPLARKALSEDDDWGDEYEQ